MLLNESYFFLVVVIQQDNEINTKNVYRMNDFRKMPASQIDMLSKPQQ